MKAKCSPRKQSQSFLQSFSAQRNLLTTAAVVTLGITVRCYVGHRLPLTLQCVWRAQHLICSLNNQGQVDAVVASLFSTPFYRSLPPKKVHCWRLDGNFTWERYKTHTHCLCWLSKQNNESEHQCLVYYHQACLLCHLHAFSPYGHCYLHAIAVSTRSFQGISIRLSECATHTIVPHTTHSIYISSSSSSSETLSHSFTIGRLRATTGEMCSSLRH